MTGTAPSDGPTPIDDGWEPEPERRGAGTWFRDGPVDYFRAVPARFFAWLGGVVFVAGWAASIYVAGIADQGGLGGTPAAYRISNLLNNGLQTTIAAALLWGVAAFLWVKILPAVADEAADVQSAGSPRS